MNGRTDFPLFTIHDLRFTTYDSLVGLLVREAGAFLVEALRVVVVPSFLGLLVALGCGETTASTISETAEAASPTMLPTPDTISEPISRTGAGMILSDAAAEAAWARKG